MKLKSMMASICIIMVGTALLILTGCDGSSSSNNSNKNEDPAEPSFEQATFTNPTQIDNEYLPLNPNTVQLYQVETEDGVEASQVETEDGVETIVVEVLEETRVVNGVTCVVVRDQEFVDELLIEDTHDWYAQDDDGNVWYMGEDVTNYEYDDEGNIISTDHEGAWEAGVDGAIPGIIMKATLIIGDSYQQEFYEGEAEDMAKIEALGVQVELEDGTIYNNCLQTLEWDPLEPDDEEYKYYAPDVGLIKEELVDGDETAEQKGIFLTGIDRVPDFEAAGFTNPTTIDNTYLPLIPGTTLTYEAETEDGVETIITEVLNTTRVVDGVECVVFNDQVFLDGLLIEDTNDWFAQDDNGNVWYMGEEVTNYEYDDDDILIDTDHDGAWEAGVDGALPGIVMWADPEAGVSYYQEYYEDEAEDMGMVVALSVRVELKNGTTYEDCLQILDWNPLDPAVLEYKYFAPDVGLVKEEVVGGDETAELI
jgi:hypothetical protein